MNLTSKAKDGWARWKLAHFYLRDIQDVDVSTTLPVDGDTLVWVDADKKWEPGTATAPTPAKDRFTVAATPATDYPLTAVPLSSSLGSSLVLSLNGLVLVEGADYTCDYTTGVVTPTATPTAGDVLYAEYWTTGKLVARMHLVEFAGTGLGAGWAMSGTTVGKRISGVWTYTTIPADTFIDEGIVDAYSVESTVTALPGGAVHADWRACVSNYPGPLTGIVLDSNNSGTTLYLFLGGSPALSTVAAATPSVGDTVKVVTDFTTKIATATLNGTTIHTLNFSTATWFFAGMVAP